MDMENIGGRWVIAHARLFGRSHIRHAGRVHDAMRDERRFVAALSKSAFSETLKSAIFADIMSQGESGYGGSFYLDGRPVSGHNLADSDTWCVGGGYPGGITLPFSEVFDEDEDVAYGNVGAAIELLREETASIQQDCEKKGYDFPVILGWWPEDGMVWFDVTNLVDSSLTGEQAAVLLARSRGELAIFNPVTKEYIRVAGAKEQHRAWHEFNSANKPARLARGYYRTLDEARRARSSK